MNELAIAACPVCQNLDGGSCQGHKDTMDGGPNAWFECDICGRYAMDSWTYIEQSSPNPNPADWSHWNLTRPQRAVLSQRIRRSQESRKPGDKLFTITRNILEWLRSSAALPSRAEQAANVIRYIGDEISRSGEPIGHLPIQFRVIIGAASRDSGFQLVRELEERGILRVQANTVGGPRIIDLTLDGWQAYEGERRGQFKSNYGFIAMQFNDAELDPFVKEVVKPAVKDRLGYDLVDMRDVARAGVIDNIMRTESGTQRSSSSTLPTTTRAPTGRPAMPRVWGNPSSTSARRRSSRQGEPTSIPITARRFPGPEMTMMVSAPSWSLRFGAHLTLPPAHKPRPA